MKTILIFFTLVIGGMIYIHHSLQDGTVLRYIDQHQETSWVPQATFTIGQAYYMFQSLDDATTYYWRVAQRYPNTPLADDAYFSYLQCRDEMVSVGRTELADGYRSYLEKYPNGKHTDQAKVRLGTYETGGR